MWKRIAPVFAGALLAGSAAPAWADHPTVGFGASTAGPAITISATPLPKGAAAVAVRVEYVKFDPFSDAELARFAGSHPHSVDYLLTPSIGVGYGFTDDFTVSARLPYVLRGNIREGHEEEGEVELHGRGDSDGVGDVTLLGQYRFLNSPAITFEGALLFGLKMPTGETGVKDRNGVVFDTEHQPGSGSWDPLFGVAFTRRFGPLSLDGNVLYSVATEGAQDTTLGDRLHYNAAVSYRLGGEKSDSHHAHHTHQHLTWDLILELNGEWQEKQKISGDWDGNSGGSTLWVSPAVKVCRGEWAGVLSVGVPVLEELNGVQHDADLRVVFGVSRGF